MPEFHAEPILSTDTVGVWDVMCPGHIRGQADEECAASTHLVFPYRGVYVHHVGRRSVVDDTQRLAATLRQRLGNDTVDPLEARN